MPVSLSYSLSDQSFERTKSLGILGLSIRLAEALSQTNAIGSLTVFSNSSLSSQLKLGPNTKTRDHNHAASNALGRAAWDQIGCYAAARRSGEEWLFLPKGFASFLRRPPRKLAAYVHDVMHDHYRRNVPGGFSKFESWYFKQALAATLRQANVIFTNTEFTRSEVLRVAGEQAITPPPVVVAGIGFAENTTAAAKLDRIVVLAGRWPHKRSDLAVDWVERWRHQVDYRGEIHLVGGLPEKLQAPPGWREHPRLPDGEFAAVLASARALVYFSDYEGFGMPPVEALVAGACPVFSDVPATREVMGGRGCPFQNSDFDSFAKAMSSALEADRATLERWSTELRARHNWASVTSRVVQALQEN